MTKSWVKAAERYEAAKQPGFKARKKRSKQEKPVPTLAEFLANGEGAAALKLLAVSGQEICLGCSQATMGHTTEVILSGEGLKSHSGMVGVAAAYSKDKPVRDPLDVPRALELLRSFPEEGNMLREGNGDQATLVLNIRAQLDAIAAEAP